MTPQDILNKKFERGMGGYKVEDVNAFLIEVSDYVGDLQEERADLLEKMEVIAEKLEEYRTDEDSLRTALLGAQKLGDSVVRDSKKKADAILADAHTKADDIVGEARKALQKEKQTLKQMQGEVSKFRNHILNMYESQMQIIKKLPFVEDTMVNTMPLQASAQLSSAPKPIETVATDEVEQAAGSPSDKAGFFTLNIEDLEDDIPNIDEDDAVSGSSSKKPSRFTDLQFGDKYRVNREE